MSSPTLRLTLQFGSIFGLGIGVGYISSKKNIFTRNIPKSNLPSESDHRVAKWFS